MKVKEDSDKLIKTKKYLKEQLQNHSFELNKCDAEKTEISSLFQEASFGNNALLIGAPKSGKTTVS